MRKVITVATLVLALSCPASAGHMATPVTGTTSTTQGVMDNGVYGNMQNPVAGDIPNNAPGIIPNDGAGTSPQTSTADTLGGAEVAFGVLRTLMGLF